MNSQEFAPISPNNQFDDGQPEYRNSFSRRTLLRGVVGAGVLIATANLAAGCSSEGSEEWSQVPMEEMVPEYESEKQMQDMLKKYLTIKDATGTESADAALLTQALSKENSFKEVAGVFKQFRRDNNASETEAALLTVSTFLPGNSRAEVADNFEDARNMERVSKDEVANIAAISSYTNKDPSTVVYYYDRVKDVHEEQVTPVIVMARLTQGDSDQTSESLDKIESAGVTEQSEKAAMLFAQTFTSANIDDLMAVKKELDANEEIDKALHGDLLVASVYNDMNVEEVLEAYNYAGGLEGVTAEAAAKLTVAMYALKTPQFKEDGKLSGRRPGEGQAMSHGGGSSVIIMPGYGYYYPMSSYGYGYAHRPSKTTFRPATRGTSISKPGAPVVRGGGRGGIAAGRGSGMG